MDVTAGGTPRNTNRSDWNDVFSETADRSVTGSAARSRSAPPAGCRLSRWSQVRVAEPQGRVASASARTGSAHAPRRSACRPPLPADSRGACLPLCSQGKAEAGTAPALCTDRERTPAVMPRTCPAGLRECSGAGAGRACCAWRCASGAARLALCTCCAPRARREMPAGRTCAKPCALAGGSDGQPDKDAAVRRALRIASHRIASTARARPRLMR